MATMHLQPCSTESAGAAELEHAPTGTPETHRGDVVVAQRVVVGDALPRVNQLDVLPTAQAAESGQCVSLVSAGKGRVGGAPVDDLAGPSGHVSPAAAAALPQALLDGGSRLVDATLHTARGIL